MTAASPEKNYSEGVEHSRRAEMMKIVMGNQNNRIIMELAIDVGISSDKFGRQQAAVGARASKGALEAM